MAINKNRASVIIVLMIISMGLENFKLIDIVGAPVKVSHLVYVAAILVSIVTTIKNKNFKLKKLIIFSLLVIIPLLPLYRINDHISFVKTYTIYLLIISFITFAFDHYLRIFRLNLRLYVNIFLIMMLIIQLLGIIQFISMNYFNYFFLEGFWKSFQFHTSIYGMQFGLYRSYSIFHEPSLFGWMSTTSFAICVFLRKTHIIKLKYFYIFQTFSVLAVMVSLSSASFFILILIIIMSILENRHAIKFFIQAFFSILIFLSLWFLTDLLNPLERLGNEISTSGSSGYERFNTPFQYVIKTFENYPILGRGLGQEGNIDNVGTLGLYEGVNNSILGIFVNFGLFAFLLIFGIIMLTIQKVIKNRSYIILFSSIFGIYVSTGAYLSLDTFIVVNYILFIGFSSEYIKSNRGAYE